MAFKQLSNGCARFRGSLFVEFVQQPGKGLLSKVPRVGASRNHFGQVVSAFAHRINPCVDLHS